MLRIFFRPKNPTASAGFEPANLGTKGQHATPRPRIMILNNVRQHKCCIIQGNYISYMFQLTDQSSSGLFSRLSHKELRTHWDPSVFTSIKYIKSDQLLLRRERCKGL